KCGGQFFDAGEMFAACGIKADPSYWDRPETGGTVRDGQLHCPLCKTFMLVQDVKYEDKHVEIDRCGTCGGIWLDRGEVDSIMKISEKLQPVLDAQRAKAQDELARMGNVNFTGPIGQFLKIFQK